MDQYEEPTFDLDALQAQINMAMAETEELVSSWVQPTKKSNTRPKQTLEDMEKELQEYLRRPPRLGVGALIPEPVGPTAREEAKLKNKLVGNGKKRRLEDFVEKNEEDVDDDSESRKGESSARTVRADPFNLPKKKISKLKNDVANMASGTVSSATTLIINEVLASTPVPDAPTEDQKPYVSVSNATENCKDVTDKTSLGSLTTSSGPTPIPTSNDVPTPVSADGALAPASTQNSISVVITKASRNDVLEGMDLEAKTLPSPTPITVDVPTKNPVYDTSSHTLPITPISADSQIADSMPASPNSPKKKKKNRKKRKLLGQPSGAPNDTLVNPLSNGNGASTIPDDSTSTITEDHKTEDDEEEWTGFGDSTLDAMDWTSSIEEENAASRINDFVSSASQVPPTAIPLFNLNGPPSSGHHDTPQGLSSKRKRRRHRKNRLHGTENRS